MRARGALAAIALLGTALVPARAAGAALPPGFASLSAHEIGVRCDVELEARRKLFAAMEKKLGAGRILDEFNALSLRMDGFDDPLGVLQNAAPERETRASAQACLEKLVPFGTELFQSTRLLARVTAFKPIAAQEESFRRLLLELFEDGGATLPPDARAQAKQLQDEISTLCLRFQRNINETTPEVTLSAAEVEGTSDTWRSRQEHLADGGYRMRLDTPSFVPFMESAVSGEARRRVWVEYQKRGGAGNLEILDRITALRSELAQAYGYPDYASYFLRRTMAGSPQAVSDFLVSVKKSVDEVEASELEELKRAKAALLGLPEDLVQVERWDVAFLQQRVRRERFHTDSDAQRALFPSEACIRYALRIAEDLYGIRFVPRDVPAWHPEVRYYEVYEQAGKGETGALLGGVYLDLYPREGKYPHAAAFGVRVGSGLTGQRPIKALIANLDRRGLDHVEFQTLLHEFGHVLHGVLSRARFADQSGTAVRRDFVEAPSQMFEEWARQPSALRLFAQVCPECPALTPDRMEEMAAARRFGRGIFYARQWLFASYDLALHSGAPKSSLGTWEQMEGASRLGHVEGTYTPAAFTHLGGGYASGYYGYLWSEVLALDMVSVFHDNLMDPAVGRRFRRVVLEPGGSRAPQELVAEFLGRAPNPEAFYAEITGRR